MMMSRVKKTSHGGSNEINYILATIFLQITYHEYSLLCTSLYLQLLIKMYYMWDYNDNSPQNYPNSSKVLVFLIYLIFLIITIVKKLFDKY